MVFLRLQVSQNCFSIQIFKTDCACCNISAWFVTVLLPQQAEIYFSVCLQTLVLCVVHHNSAQPLWCTSVALDLTLKWDTSRVMQKTFWNLTLVARASRLRYNSFESHFKAPSNVVWNRFSGHTSIQIWKQSGCARKSVWAGGQNKVHVSWSNQRVTNCTCAFTHISVTHKVCMWKL